MSHYIYHKIPNHYDTNFSDNELYALYLIRGCEVIESAANRMIRKVLKSGFLEMYSVTRNNYVVNIFASTADDSVIEQHWKTDTIRLGVKRLDILMGKKLRERFSDIRNV